MILKDLLALVSNATVIDLCTEDFFQLRLFVKYDFDVSKIDAYLEKEVIDVTVNDYCLLVRIAEVD